MPKGREEGNSEGNAKIARVHVRKSKVCSLLIEQQYSPCLKKYKNYRFFPSIFNLHFGPPKGPLHILKALLSRLCSYSGDS